MNTPIKIIPTSELPATIPAGFTVVPVSRIDGKKGKSGNCALVPSLSDWQVESFSASPTGKKAIARLMMSVQSKILTEGMKTGTKEFSHYDINELAIERWLEKDMAEKEAVVRLSTELIKKWFGESLAPVLAAKLQETTPGISASKIATIQKGFLDSFCKLAAPKGADSLSDAVKLQLLKLIELKGEDWNCPVAAKIVARMNKEEEEPQDEEDITSINLGS